MSSRSDALEALSAEKASAENALGKLRNEAAEHENALDGYRMIIDSRAGKVEKLRKELEAANLDIYQKNARIKMLDDLEKNLDGYAGSVQKVIRESKRGALRGIHGTLSQLITATPEYAVAIETALGAAIQNIVTDDENAAKRAINYLKENRAGRATFLPLTSVKARPFTENGLANCEGFVDMADKLLDFDPKYAGIIGSLLGRTAVVDNIDNGIAMAKKYSYRFKIVTLDGQVLNAGGSMTGGSVSRSAGILSRSNELKELSAKRGGLQEKLDFALRDAEEAKRELTKAQYELEVAQTQQRSADEAVLKLSGEKNHYDILLSSLRGRLEDMEQELETIERRRSEALRAIGEKEALVARQEQEAAAFKALAEEKLSGQSELLQSSSRLGDQITEYKSRLAGYTAERETTEQALRSLESLREQMRGDEQSRQALIGQYRTANEQAGGRIAEHTAAADALRIRAEEKRGQIAELVKRKLALEAEQNQSNSNLRELNDTVLKLSNAAGKLEQKKATTAMEEQQILDKLWENYELSHTAAQEQRIELESVPKANRRISELKREIGGLGSVNVGAIEEFDRVNTRYTYLTTQRDDVEKAKEELLGIIESITGEMTGIFKEQFALIRESFQQTFLELFGGGKATLELEDENDVLACGIEIKVQPPGKALKTITLLSGGEKAFVAIALYFAILKVHPTPFCVMDEIEAALDEPNVVRVANYMRRITEKTQFIVITHRRGTMEAADVLYGVTMQERGVSKVLTINMNDMAKELNIKG